MAILNVTPDSFSDGGLFHKDKAALQRVDTLIKEGADIIDIGGESTRPGADEVSTEEELSRVIPIVEAIKSRFDITVSVDTSKAEVMQAAINADVDMINDVRALQLAGAIEACVNSSVSICLMHMQGQPQSMQKKPAYQNILQDISDFFSQRIDACVEAGIDRNRIILDPGFGFGKTLEHNSHLLNNIDYFQSYKLPILVGLSRKTMIGSLLGDAPVSEREIGSVAAVVIAAMKGAKIIRVHDVKITADAMKVVKGILKQ